MGRAVFPPCYFPGAKLWWTSLVAQVVKCLPMMQETRVQSLDQEDLLEKEMATHSSILAWKIPRTEEPGGLVYGITKSRTQLSDFTFTLNYGGGNEDNGDLLQKVPCTTALSAPNPAAATTDPRLCWRLLDTHRQVWVSLLWGHCSFLLDPGAHNILFVPSKSLFPQSSVRSGSSRMALMATSSKRAYAIPRSATPRAPAPAAGHC